jgi:hypothetical protein
MMKYFWYYRPEANFPPPCVTRPEEVQPTDRLAVSCTQTRPRPAEERKLVQHWSRFLPTLVDVRFLWLASKVPQELFDAACRMQSLEGFWIKWSGLASIDALQENRTLRYFHLGSSTGLRSIDPLSQHRQLKWLGLENLKRIRDIEPVGELTELEGLTIEGSMWSTQRIRSLAPLGRLKSLR